MSRAFWRIVLKRLKIWWERQKMIFSLLNNLALTINILKMKLKKVGRTGGMTFYQQFSVQKLRRRNLKMRLIFKRSAREWTYRLTRRTSMSFLTKMRTTKTVLSQTKTEKCSTVQRAINKRTCVPRHPTSRAHNNLIKSLPAFQSYNRHSSQKALAKFLQAVHRRQRHRWSRQISNNFTSVLSYLM